jgi:hypothetical protein
MAQDANGTPTSPDSIATLLPADLPAVTSLTSGVNAISASVQTALTTNYPRISGAKTTNNTLVWNGTSWIPQMISDVSVLAGAGIAYSKLTLTNSVVNADINTAAAIAYSKLNLSGGIVNADINAAAAIAGSKIGTGLTPDKTTAAVSITYRSTTQSFAAADGTVSFDTSLYSVGTAMWSGGNPTRVTVPYTGTYRVGALLLITPGIGAYSVNIRKNGSVIVMGGASGQGGMGQTNGNGYVASTYITLAANDYLEILWVHGSSTAASSQSVTYPYTTPLPTFGLLEVEYIGA